MVVLGGGAVSYERGTPVRVEATRTALTATDKCSLRLKDLLGPATRVKKKKELQVEATRTAIITIYADRPLHQRDRRTRPSRIRGSQTLVSISLRLKDLPGPVTRVKKKKRRHMQHEPPPPSDLKRPQP